MRLDLFNRRMTHKGYVGEFPARGSELCGNFCVKAASFVHKLAPRTLVIRRRSPESTLVPRRREERAARGQAVQPGMHPQSTDSRVLTATIGKQSLQATYQARDVIKRGVGLHHILEMEFGIQARHKPEALGDVRHMQELAPPPGSIANATPSKIVPPTAKWWRWRRAEVEGYPWLQEWPEQRDTFFF
jgi:hypothetical protein